jgi:hypothetical protein
MRYSDLIKEYRQLRSFRKNKFAPNGVFENAVPVHETDRIRILLIRHQKQPRQIKMEIEITLPERMWGLDANLTINERSSPNQSDLRMSLEETIILFQYIIDLQAAGFSLDYFNDEGVWVASYAFEKEPTKTLFARFKPPKITAN